VRRTLSASHLD